MESQLETCCVGLESTKVLERKKNADLLRQLLDNKAALKCLSGDSRLSWDSVIESVHVFLRKEAEKLREDESKNKTSSVYSSKISYGDLLVIVINKANSRNAKLDVTKLVTYFLQYFNSSILKKYFDNAYLNVLKEFLSNQRNYSDITTEECLELLQNLKARYNTLSSNDNHNKIKPLQSLEYLFQWGPLYNLPSCQLRREFPFMIELANQINSTSSRSMLEVVIKIILKFCQQVAEDNRVACCKLGEALFTNFIGIYQSQVYDVKVLIMKFFLLQVQIHHPRGSYEGTVSAYACSWIEWRKFLRSMYSVLCSEINDHTILKSQANLGVKVNIILLPKEFLELVVEIFRQVYNPKYSTAMLEVTQQDVSQQPNKKRRVEVGIPAIIDLIQENKDWLWISVVTELLRKYPNLISAHDFVNLLRVLSAIQAESKFANTRYHLYECLATLIDVQVSIDVSNDTVELKQLWTLVSDSTLRSIGLNENEEKTHKLLQKLISTRKPINSMQLFEPYLSQVVNVSKFSLHALNEACSHFDLSTTTNTISTGTNDERKKTLIRWILNIENKRYNTNVFLEEITAQILLSLTFKQWPHSNGKSEKRPSNESDKTTDCLYLITSFDNQLVLSQSSSEHEVTGLLNGDSYLSQSELLSYLIEELYNFALSFTQSENTNFPTLKNMINVSALLANTLSFMLKYSVLANNILERHKLCNILNILIEKWSFLFCLLVTKVKEKNKHLVVDIFKQIKFLLTLNLHDSIYVMVRTNISTDVIKTLFELLNQDSEGDEGDMDRDGRLTTHRLDQLALTALDVLCTFSCVPNTECVFDVQQQILQVLAKPDFDPHVPVDYELAMEFLLSLNKYTPGTLSDDILEMILKNIQNICETHYKNYDTAENILKILYNLYPHIAKAGNNELEENSLVLLYPFYDGYNNYGPNVSIALLNCMGQLAVIDKNIRWSKWSGNNDIPSKIPEFLSSNYQSVRITAIKNLFTVFNITCQTEIQLERQNDMFENVCLKSFEVFNVMGDLSEEQQIDETVTRTASALHTFATIMATSPIFRQKALFALLQLVQSKKLNMETTQSILKMVSKHIGIDNAVVFIEINLKYLIAEWRGSLKDFPYTLLNCSTELEFYSKYTEVAFPMLFATNQELLNEVCEQLNRPIRDVIESCYANVIARCLLTLTSEASDASSTSQKEINFKNNCITNLTSVLSQEECEDLIVSKLDQVICSLLGYCFDSEHVNEKLGVFCVFPKPQSPVYTVTVIKSTINYVEDKYLNSQPLISYCAQNCQSVLQKILSNSIANVYNANSTEEKIISFYRCTIFMDFIMSFVQDDTDYNVYFIRTICYNLIHLISDNYKTDSLLNLICCKYLCEFLTNILPTNAKIIQTFLVTFVSSLIPIAKCDTRLGSECIELLNLTIVNHSRELLEGIKLLDPFPQEEKFARMQVVYNSVRYNGSVCLLENDICRFLKTNELMGATGNRIEGLKHLKNELSSKKDEVKRLYYELQQSKGFSEDCAKSVIHQLICVLVKLSLSTDANESIEATRCLGELGFADLSSTVLQAEQSYASEISNPYELVTGCIAGLLSKYIVSSDVKLVQVASEALYHVLDLKEGKTILTSEIDYGHGIVNQFYVKPFITNRKSLPNSNFNLKPNFENEINCNSLWCPQSPTTHSDWIINLVSTILETFNEKCYLNCLIPICKVKVEFAEKLLPLLIYLILTTKYSNMISSQMQQFFSKHWDLTTQGWNESECIYTNKLSVQCMLNVVHFIRIRQNCKSIKAMEELSLNYLHVAQAAQFCTAHFTALLYVELWSQERIKELRNSSEGSFYKSILTPLECIVQNEEPNIQQALRTILKESYTKVGEFDALNACETIGLLSNDLQIERSEHLQQWDQVVLQYDIQISQGDSSKAQNMLNALKQCSIYHLPLKYNFNVEAQYECAWRLNQWTFNKTDLTGNENFEAYKYFALKAIHDSDTTSFTNAIKDARSSVIYSLTHASLESSRNLYEPLNCLQSIRELENFVEAKRNYCFESILKKWKIQDQINSSEFCYLELIQSQRIVLLKDLVNSGYETMRSPLIEMYLTLTKLARMEDKCSIASRALGNLVSMPNLSSEIKNEIMMERAQICWASDKTTARYIIRRLLNSSLSPRLEAAALKLYGVWMVETFSENPTTIIEDYFKKSINILTNLEKNDVDVKNIMETYDVLARFADSEYQKVVSYIKSSVFEQKVRNMEKSKETANNLKRQGFKPRSDESRATIVHDRQSRMDKAEIENTHKDKQMYLVLAMKYYLLYLCSSDANDVRMFRLLSLWIENRSNTAIALITKSKLEEIPSYKFVPLLPQLVPHVTNNDEDNFGQQINSIITRCAKDHPHHTLPIVLAVANSNRDKDMCNSTTTTASNEVRVSGAENLIESFKKQPALKPIVLQLIKLSDALIEMAYVDRTKCRLLVDKDEEKTFANPSTCLMNKIKDFSNILVPTYTLPIRKCSDYTNIIGISSFKKTFVYLGGINAPKRIICVCTDGILRVQLVKGQDDIRQDAVMQQVFNIMNGFLKANKQTSRLQIRTYKVVPLSQRSGILEWVDSISLGNYLTGKGKAKGAHEMYNPQDITPQKCRTDFDKLSKLPNNEKLIQYKKICKKFHPVLHKFFEKTFVQPAVCYERRRAYMYSVATTSMCGYILGLGDRHVQNILLDENTAELIHIDFGIAFEQGLILPTPETVPFRLTRDIEAGMGISGIEGIFRRSCEKTLEVLRKNAETIITIVEVLLYDPLYTWTITPAEAYSRQLHEDSNDSSVIHFSDQENVSANITAERALLRLRQKLQGITEGTATSVEVQVEKLLQQARDPSNLSRLYVGWQPYL